MIVFLFTYTLAVLLFAVTSCSVDIAHHAVPRHNERLIECVKTYQEARSTVYTTTTSFIFVYFNHLKLSHFI